MDAPRRPHPSLHGRPRRPGLGQDRAHRPPHAQRRGGLLRLKRTSTPSWRICRTASCCRCRRGPSCPWSPSRERFLGIPRTGLLVEASTASLLLETKIGRLVRDAFENGNTLDQEEVETETGRRVQVHSTSWSTRFRPGSVPRCAIDPPRPRIRPRTGKRARALLPPRCHRPPHLRRRSRGQEPHQRHRRASGAARNKPRARRLRHATPRDHRKRDPAP